MKKIFLVVTFINIAIILISCEKEPVIIPVVSVSLSESSITLIEGETLMIRADIYPADATNKSIIWSSSNVMVATVNGGIITANKMGQTIITAKSDDGSKTASCVVTVTPRVYPVTSVSLDKVSLEMVEGEIATLIATVSPDNATDKSIEWTSNDSSIATVRDGLVTAIKAGEAIISVKTNDGDRTANCKVVVHKKPTFFLNCTFAGIVPKMDNRIINVIPSSLVGVYIDGTPQDSISQSYFFDEGTEHYVSLEFDEEIMTIPNHLFNSCTALTSIEFPKSVKTIGREAFSGCKSLKTILLPEGLYVIEDEAFRYCSSLKEISIPDSTYMIGSYAFQSVEFEKLYIGKSLKEIGIGALNQNNNAITIEVNEENPYYDSRESCNALINSSTNEMLIACKNSFIPKDIESIGPSCFGGLDIKYIEIPDSVNTIESYAFVYCYELVMNFGNTRTKIPNISYGNFFTKLFVVPDALYDYWVKAWKDTHGSDFKESRIIKYSDYLK